MTWLSWIVFASALFAAGANAFYLVKFPKSDKWLLRLVNALAICYFGLLYLLIGLERFDLSRSGPFLIRPGIGLLLLLLASEVLFDLVRRK